MAEKLELIFSNTFQGKIWKILADEDEKHVAIELRSDSSLEVKFFCLDIKSLVLSDINLPQNDWWTSLTAIRNGKVYIKQFESEGNPKMKELLVWDILKQTKLDFSGLDEVENDHTNVSRLSFYPKSNEHFATLKEFVEAVTEKKVLEAGIEYLEFETAVILSYYAKDKAMANYLLVTDHQKQVLLHECIGQDLKGIGQDTFIVSNNKLIFVKDKQQLFIYQFN